MTQKTIAPQIRVGGFDTMAEADRAIRRLLASGFSKDQLAVICPAQFKDHFLPEVPRAKAPSGGPGELIARGGAVGATLGGLALAATAISGGTAGALAAVVFIGGGALAGGFSNLLAAMGYDDEPDDYFREAIEHGQIVVGVEVQGEDFAEPLEKAQLILDEEGAKPLAPA